MVPNAGALLSKFEMELDLNLQLGKVFLKNLFTIEIRENKSTIFITAMNLIEI